MSRPVKPCTISRRPPKPIKPRLARNTGRRRLKPAARHRGKAEISDEMHGLIAQLPKEIEEMRLRRGKLAPNHQNECGIEQDLVGNPRRVKQGTGEFHRREMADLGCACKSLRLAYNPAPLIRTARRKGMPWRFFDANAALCRYRSSEMPKLK